MKLELKQKKLFAGERQFRFKDKTTLSVICKTLKTHKEYLIDIVALDPKIKSQFIFAKKPLISFIVFANLSLILSLTSVLDSFPAIYQSGVVVVTSIFTLISLIAFIVLTRHERIFVSRHSKVPLVRFYNGLPGKKEFKKFVQFIQAESQKRFEHLKLNLQQQRAGELKTIRRIQEQGGLTASQYEKAKNKLLTLSDEA